MTETLTQASHKLAEAMYKQASQAGDQQAGAEGGAESGAQPGPSPADDDVVDADFEEVKDDK